MRRHICFRGVEALPQVVPTPPFLWVLLYMIAGRNKGRVDEVKMYKTMRTTVVT